ncbi:FHA domain-containing protein [Arthrobacter sp. TWP1-1]|uniref:FHA domain-containing protein n=1 Tax=Arthrobacter sp. TWP1-1 TaxID=2804568 RepID=UPI003CF6692B
MVSTTYSTGSWLGIVRSGSVIVLEGQTDPALVGELWDYLGQEPTIHGVLNEVTEKFGTGITGMPHFAIVVQSDRLHAILRGNMTLLAHTAHGTETVSGRDVTTWSERSLPLADSIELTLDETGLPADSLSLPLAEGVVRLQSLSIVTQGPALAAVHPSVPAFEPEADPNDDFGPSDFVADEVPEATVPEGAADDAGDDATADAAPDDEADDAADEIALEPEYDEETLASFAKAAEAADAEWNAQLVPLDAPDALEKFINGADFEDSTDYEDGTDDVASAEDIDPADLSRTIIPDRADESDHADEPEVASETAVDDVSDGSDKSPAAAETDGAAEADSATAAVEAVDDGFTVNYDYLFGATTMAQSVEAAAVRLDEDGQPIPQETAEHAVPPMPALPPVAGSSAESALAENAETAGEADAPVPATGPEGIMIDSVPWGKPAARAAEFGGSAVAESSAVAVAGPASGPDLGLAGPGESYDPDHDGHTVMRGDFITELNNESEPAAQLESRPPTGPMVLARMCPNGHANPPSRSQCSNCGSSINSEPREVGRPRLGTMHISTGEVVELDHSLIIGRQPSVSRVMGGAMPRLVQVKSGNGDISRSHVEVRLDGWEVLLVDLKATNGTVLVREGQSPRRLSQGEEAILLNGDIAELGDGVSLLFDGLL